MRCLGNVKLSCFVFHRRNIIQILRLFQLIRLARVPFIKNALNVLFDNMKDKMPTMYVHSPSPSSRPETGDVAQSVVLHASNVWILCISCFLFAKYCTF